MIQVSADPARKLVSVVMQGMLTVDEVANFASEKEAAVRQMGLRTGEYLLLVTTKGNVVQTREVMEAFQHLILEADLKAKRIATVRDGVLSRMQSRRMARLRDGSEIFDDVAEAEAWLFA